MENLNKPILVPWDFTYVADNAYAHAINVATALGREIIILNLVDKEEDISVATEKLVEKAKELTKEFKIKTNAIVKAGVIFDEIREVANDYKAEMVVMGTHGRKGVQKITGSWALKVMASSKIPFLVVQDKPKKKNFEKIVFPIDFRKENKEKVNWVNYLAKHFNSKFFLFRRHVSDRGFKRRIISNVVYAENILKNNNVEYEVALAKGKNSFEKEIVDFSQVY
jgi:nucleotide-binding universal stress UspA family protein